MKKDKFNQIVDQVIKNEKQIMENINELIQDKGKKNPYFSEQLANLYAECGRTITLFTDLKTNVNQEPLPEEFGLQPHYAIELEVEEDKD